MNWKHVTRAVLVLAVVMMTATVFAQPSAHDRLGGGTRGGDVRVGGGDPVLPEIRDAGLESSTGTPISSPSWNSGSVAYQTPICNASCGFGGDTPTTGPRNGSFWAWFGGIGGFAETAYMEQVVVLPDLPDLWLQFYQWIGTVDADATLTIKVDGNTVDTQTITGAGNVTVGYVSRFVNISAYADGGVHTIRFDYVQSGTGSTTNWSVDDVTLYGFLPAVVLNSDFETDPVDPWTVSNGTGDKLKCNKPGKTFSHTGDCAFRFKGGVGESSKIKQDAIFVIRNVLPVPAPGGRAPANQTVVFGAMVDAGPSAAGNMKVKLTLAGDVKWKSKVSLAPTTGYQWVQTPVDAFTPQTVVSANISVKHKGLSGKVYVDDAYVFLQAY